MSSEVLTTIRRRDRGPPIAVLIPAIATQAGNAVGHPGDAADDRVRRRGRPRQRRADAGGRPECRRVAQRRRRVDLHRRYRQRQEVAITTSGGLGEAEVGGPAISIVPKTGGNTFKGAVYLSGVPSGWVGSNYTTTLRRAGLTTPGALIKQWDFTGGIGGPIKKDRLWFFVTAATKGSTGRFPGSIRT